MVQELHYDTLLLVLQSWDKLKAEIPDYKKTMGALIYQDLFLNCPETKTLFGFDETTDPSDPAFLKSPRFLSHAENLISMLDSALDMLGPDQETLTEILRGLGKRHSENYGVQPRMYAYMRQSLVTSLQRLFGDSYVTKELKDAWQEVFHAFAADMVPDDANDDWHASMYGVH